MRDECLSTVRKICRRASPKPRIFERIVITKIPDDDHAVVSAGRQRVVLYEIDAQDRIDVAVELSLIAIILIQVVNAKGSIGTDGCKSSTIPAECDAIHAAIKLSAVAAVGSSGSIEGAPIPGFARSNIPRLHRSIPIPRCNRPAVMAECH